ncbi:MAG: outer membrane protein assembly factor BamA [Burkholderiaceae bacterium]
MPGRFPDSLIRLTALRGFVARLMVTLLLAMGALSDAIAFEPFTIGDIRVEGIQRIEAGTVFSYLPVRVGEQMTDARASQTIRSLYATGFFRDVRLEVEGDVLIVFVSERPAIAKVETEGSVEFSEEVLEQVLSDIGLAENQIFDRSVLDRAEQEIKRQYLSRGKYAVQVTSTVTPLERNRVALNLKILEGGVARIAAIRFVGNTEFTDAQLLDQLRLSTPTWLSWYTKNDQYAREKLAGDLEVIRSFYLDRGYLDFEIQSTQVSITPDKQDVHITVVVKEGKPFEVQSFEFVGNMLGREEEFTQLLSLEPGQTFSGTELNESRRRIVERLGELGFAFANVNAQPDLNREDQKVKFTVLIDPGRRVYVRRINISGNTQTRDVVVRRELRQFENAWYDADKIRLSRERLGRLGYFTDVRVDTIPVPGVPDQVDLEVKVTETATGNILFGVGTSSSEAVILSASINQRNFLGSGKSLALDVNTSQISRKISLTYVDPYFTRDGVSRTFQFYSRLFNANELELGNYQWRSNGLGLTFGVPYTEIDRVSFGLAVENNTLDLTVGGDDPSPNRFIDYAFGTPLANQDPNSNEIQRADDGVGRSSTALLAKLGWKRDTRDNIFTPTRGRLHEAALEGTLPVGELRYYKLTYNQQYFYPINKDYTLALNADLGYAESLGGRQFPPFENFYAGGIGSVRGFRSSSLGPGRDPVDNVALGGQTRVVGSAELILPIAGTGNDRTFRWFVFLDGGNVFPAGQFDASDFRYSTGLGLTWISPIGPMKFSLGYPLNDKPEDREQRLQFQIGTGF